MHVSSVCHTVFAFGADVYLLAGYSATQTNCKPKPTNVAEERLDWLFVLLCRQIFKVIRHTQCTYHKVDIYARRTNPRSNMQYVFAGHIRLTANRVHYSCVRLFVGLLDMSVVGRRMNQKVCTSAKGVQEFRSHQDRSYSINRMMCTTSEILAVNSLTGW